MRFAAKHPDAPWLTESAIYVLNEWLRPGDVGLEWGSGRSTIWFAGRVARLTSVEADKEWFNNVSRQLKEKGLAGKTDYRHIACDLHEIDEPTTHPYASVAEEFADGSLDFALVDGHIRATCFGAVLPKLKPGGLLILDNANRYIPNEFLGEFATSNEPRSEPRTKTWAELIREIKSWRSIHTTDKIWDTRMWVKPC